MAYGTFYVGLSMVKTNVGRRKRKRLAFIKSLLIVFFE